MFIKPKEILLSDGVTYAPAVVSVNLDGTVNAGGNVTMGNVTMNVSTLATAAEQSNQTTLLTAIRDNTANITGGGGGSTNITTLATVSEQVKQTTNLSLIANQTAGLANLTVQQNHTGILQAIANNTAVTTNITTLATHAKQDEQTAKLTTLTAKVVEANLPVYNVTVTSYDSFNNPLVIVYKDKTTLAVVMTQTCTYDGVGRFVSSVLS